MTTEQKQMLAWNIYAVVAIPSLLVTIVQAIRWVPYYERIRELMRQRGAAQERYTAMGDKQDSYILHCCYAAIWPIALAVFLIGVFVIGFVRAVRVMFPTPEPPTSVDFDARDEVDQLLPPDMPEDE
jgi:hypothetical protein